MIDHRAQRRDGSRLASQGQTDAFEPRRDQHNQQPRQHPAQLDRLADSTLCAAASPPIKDEDAAHNGDRNPDGRVTHRGKWPKPSHQVRMHPQADHARQDTRAQADSSDWRQCYPVQRSSAEHLTQQHNRPSTKGPALTDQRPGPRSPSSASLRVPGRSIAGCRLAPPPPSASLCARQRTSGPLPAGRARAVVTRISKTSQP